MAGIINSIEGIQLFCVICQLFSQGKLHKMKATDQYIWSEPSDDIQDPFVGTSADQHFFPSFIDQEILLMPEIFRNYFSILQHCKTGGASMIENFILVAGVKGKAITNHVYISGKNQAVVILQGNIQSDILPVSIIMWFKGIPTDIYRRFPVFRKESGKTASVVVMPM